MAYPIRLTALSSTIQRSPAALPLAQQSKAMMASPMSAAQGQPQGTLVALSQIPQGTAYYSMLNPTLAPMPCIPDTNLSVYLETNEQYFVDDLNFSYPTNAQPDNPEPQPPGGQPYPDGSLWLTITSIGAQQVSVLLTNTVAGQPYTLMSQTALPSLTSNPLSAFSPAPNWMMERHITGAPGSSSAVQVPTLSRQNLFFWACGGWIDGPENLWLQPLGLTNNSSGFALVLWGASSQDQTYEILTAPSPFGPWTSQQSLVGVEFQDATNIVVPTDGHSALFVCARSDVSQDDSGIPTWWEQLYGLANPVNPYALDPSGDAYSILQDYMFGFAYGVFHTPQPPLGLAASYNVNSGMATVTWNPSPGQVNGYTLQRYDPATGQTNQFFLPNTATSYHDYPPESLLRSWQGTPVYSLTQVRQS